MLGAIFGDIVGSAYEFRNTHNYDFKLLSDSSEFTDDSVMTLAIAKGLMESYGRSDDEIKESLINWMKKIGKRYPYCGYGSMFYHWVLSDNREPYNSYGNGSAMRVSPSGWLFDTLEKSEQVAGLTAEVTHNHIEGIKGAKAVSAAIFMARNGNSKEEIKKYIESTYHYKLDKTMADIVSNGHGEEICQVSVPQALVCFLHSDSYIDTIRKAVSIGGDSDTIACIAGSIAEAYYGLPDEYRQETLNRLPDDLKEIVSLFEGYRKNRVQCKQR